MTLTTTKECWVSGSKDAVNSDRHNFGIYIYILEHVFQMIQATADTNPNQLVTTKCLMFLDLSY